jgi:hypothetical protein
MTWTPNRILALVIGIVFTLVGILGFFSTSTMQPSYIFGFGVDVVHNIVHLVIGLLGIAAAFTGWSRLYNQIFGIIYLLLGIAGLIPALYFLSMGSTRLLGLTFVNGADNVLHIVVGLVQIGVGFFVHETRTTSNMNDLPDVPRATPLS